MSKKQQVNKQNIEPKWVPSTWATEEDIERSLLAMAEYVPPDDFKAKMPDTLKAHYMKQLKELKGDPKKRDEYRRISNKLAEDGMDEEKISLKEQQQSDEKDIDETSSDP